jgi:hypothetical protein
LTTACSINKGPGGAIKFEIDEAEIIGETIGSFQLIDGSEGRIRKLGNRFSVKLQKYLRVIPIQNATAVQFLEARTVGDRTLVIMEKSERNCAYKTQIFAIRGSEVSGWDMGDCTRKPTITFNPDHASFDFANGNQTTRYTYADGRVVRGNMATLPGGVPGSQIASGKPIADDAPRYVPPPPITVGDTTSRPSAAAPVKTAAVNKPPAKPKSATAPTPPQAVKFEGQEQKATIILVLDK